MVFPVYMTELLLVQRFNPPAFGIKEYNHKDDTCNPCNDEQKPGK